MIIPETTKDIEVTNTLTIVDYRVLEVNHYGEELSTDYIDNHINVLGKFTNAQMMKFLNVSHGAKEIEIIKMSCKKVIFTVPLNDFYDIATYKIMEEENV